MRYLMMACILLIVMSSCKSKQTVSEVAVPVESVSRHDSVAKSHDTSREMSMKHDSVWIHDSICIDRSRDTLLIERWHTAWRERVRVDTLLRSRVDTIIITKVDSVAYPVTVRQTEIVEVERPLRWWEKTLMWIGVVALVSASVWGLWKWKK